MKKPTFPLSAAFLAALALLGAGCGSDSQAKELRKESAEAWSALKSYTADKKDALLEQVEKNRDRLGTEIDELKVEAAKLSGEARVELDKKLVALGEKRVELTKKLEEVRAKSGDAWAEVREGLGDAYEDLRKSVEEARRSFK